MLKFNKIQYKLSALPVLLLFTILTTQAQSIKPAQPKWWFGISGAANFNFDRGTTQMLNNSLTVPTAFHKGNGVRPYASVLTEYRPSKVFGGMLNIAYDGRGGKFDGVVAPCNCPATLSTDISYITIEPSLRIAPFSSGFYVFAGPTISFNMGKEFTYMQQKQTDVKSDWSDIRKTVFSAQAGAGIDIPVSSKTSRTQMTLSPFVSFLTDLGHQPRSVETWSFYTVRAGVALKFGSRKKSAPVVKKSDDAVVVVKETQVQFTVRAPLAIPVTRKVKETLPIRNSVFFDMGSAAIPVRYVQLNQSQASSFKEEQLQQAQPDNLNKGRSARQLAVYHNILNIIGDRMRSNPQSAILLSGASDKNPAEGKVMAENIKRYLVTVFGINPNKITTEGRDKPLIPSEQPGATKELALLREGDRRVDIQSTSPELLLQVGGSSSPFLKPVQMIAIQDDPLDSHVVFNAAGAEESMKYWSVDVTDSKGMVQHFGPFIKDMASIPGKTILGNNNQGSYKVVMTGETKTGQIIKAESSLNLVKAEDAKQEGLRYSILFDFDKSKTIASYEKFLTDVVTPLIPDNSTVIIHGHTDIIGEEKYNQNLSNERALGTQQILERAGAGKKGVKFQTYGYGEDISLAPFENNLPEERFYNRTVIIDIVPDK